MTLPAPFMDIDLPLPDRREGKVRVSYASGADRLFITTDRLSAFDRVVSGVAHKGQVLNQLAAWWFAATADIVANHVIDVPDPNVLLARNAEPLPVEVVVRGYITGVTSTSLWQQYADGAREIYGHRFPDGLRKNTPLPAPIITPTTKAAHGGHDEPLTCTEVTERGLVEPAMWEAVQHAALALFARGQEVAARAGLIFADTKYEFGLADDGTLLLIDEMHTPDSSRYWIADSYAARVAAGHEPESLDKEVVRRALLDAGYRGNGAPPTLADEVWAATSARYIDAYERITGRAFVPGRSPVDERITEVLAHAH
jgi:phosphoribosylaminoimidazole-succinocarboxamide synthase